MTGPLDLDWFPSIGYPIKVVYIIYFLLILPLTCTYYIGDIRHKPDHICFTFIVPLYLFSDKLFIDITPASAH